MLKTIPETNPGEFTASLVQSAEFLRSLIREIAQPFAVIDRQGRFLLWNRVLEGLTGYSPAELMERHSTVLFAPSEWETQWQVAEQALATRQPQTRTTQWQTRSSQQIPVELHYVPLESPEGEPLLLLLVFNLSERQRLEAELRQSQKMEGIGRLAGGIAHDFNNVLTTILGLTEAMMNGQAPPTSESLREIHQAASHAASLTHSLLAFSRRQILQMRILRLEEVVENMAKMVARLIGEDIRLEISCEKPVPPIRADQSQLEQALLNLCLNARDAMPQGGELRLEVRAKRPDERWRHKQENVPPGEYVLLSVRDTGEGMDEETLRQIFEPFFTRKSVGKGTGLGLSLVYGIVEQHEGFIQVASQVGEGTEFCIYFPAASGEPEPIRAQSTRIPARGSATVLVVEDDGSVRRLVLEVLPKLGYRVFTAADGEEAIRVFKRWADQIDLVLLDAILPKKGSREVYEQIRTRKPSVRFLFTSGYKEVFINKKFEMDTSFLFLRKPFTSVELASMIQA
ncbi:MAG: PAS domain S-box protein, partial [Acidobacteria bacterium]|nr:PAS domain S-box protein [Acidobacteriota bacterium]